jgi:hypothetical protein
MSPKNALTQALIDPDVAGDRRFNIENITYITENQRTYAI